MIDLVVNGQQLPANTEEEDQEVEHNELAQSNQIEEGVDLDQGNGKERDQQEDGDRAQARSSAASIKTFSFQDQVVNQSCLEASAQKTDSNSRKVVQQSGEQQASKNSESQQIRSGNDRDAAP